MINMAFQDDTGEVRGVNPAWVRISGLPEENYKAQRLHTIQHRPNVSGLEEAVRIVGALARGELEMPLVLLVGTSGLGKTHLSYAAGWMTLSRGKTVAFYSVPDLLDELKRGYEVSSLSPDQRGNERTYEAIMGWMQRVHLLILDDMGMEKKTDWSAEKLDQIVNYRYTYHKPTLITSNTLDLSPRIVSRCREGMVVVLKGPDYRASKK